MIHQSYIRSPTSVYDIYDWVYNVYAKIQGTRNVQCRGGILLDAATMATMADKPEDTIELN